MLASRVAAVIWDWDNAVWENKFWTVTSSSWKIGMTSVLWKRKPKVVKSLLIRLLSLQSGNKLHPALQLLPLGLLAKVEKDFEKYAIYIFKF